MSKKVVQETKDGNDTSNVNIADDENRRVLLRARMEQSYSGPLPSPQDFAAYKETLPTAPERILEMAEREQEHRHKIERNIIGKKGRENLLGQIFAF